MKTKKNKSLPKIEVFFTLKSSEDQKKVFNAFRDYIRPEFVPFIRAGCLLIVSSSSGQISMGGRLNLDGGRVPPTI